MRSRHFACLALAAAFVLFARGPMSSAVQDEERAAEIISPDDGEKVGAIEDLEGRLLKAGYPVVLVRPIVGDEPWFVQGPVEGVAKNKKFNARIYLGDTETKSSTKFRLVIVVAKDREAALKFVKGTRMENLPALPRSEFVTVRRK
jgi:hypothetical protein